MRYIKFFGCTQFCGTDFEIYEAFEDSITDNELDLISDEYTFENANEFEDIEVDYSIYEENYDTEEEYLEARDEASEQYYSECYGDWLEITEEEYNENKS